MSAPIRVVYVPHVQELIGQVQRDSDEIPYVPKSDYDELQAKLTVAEEKLAKIYATEPVSLMAVFMAYQDNAEEPALIPKPQEAV